LTDSLNYYKNSDLDIRNIMNTKPLENNIFWEIFEYQYEGEEDLQKVKYDDLDKNSIKKLFKTL